MPSRRDRFFVAAAAVAALALSLFLHGAVPFLALPTLGQAVWATGFSQSFLNQSLLSIHAANFGAPQPAPIAFGLAGAWPAALLMACGLHPADAYAAMIALWLGLAFASAHLLARRCGVAGLAAVLGAALWLSMPIVWVHAEYSMLSLGFALLPFYFLCALGLLLPEFGIGASAGPRAALHLAACIIAAFMDGYSFVMFALGAAVLGAWLFVRLPERRRSIALFAAPVHLAGVALAAVLYRLYTAGFHFEQAPLEHFRAWGLDLAFLAVPTAGVHWLADVFGLSAARSEHGQFGDWSVWSSTFALPLLVAGLLAWWRVRRASALASGLLVASVLGFYLALGPSLKVGSAKPLETSASPLMPAAHAVAPTGSAWLSANVPGLRQMRASYRWIALTTFCAWLLLMLQLAARKRADALLAMAAAAAVALLNLPDIPRKWRGDAQNREMFLRIDAELLADMRRDLRPAERVAFLPFGNDFLANYLAARLGLVAYNVGGDKNLAAARPHWPETLGLFRMDAVDQYFAGHVVLLLLRREADAVVLPRFDLLRAAHQWPAPSGHGSALDAAVSDLAASGFVSVAERGHYSVVRLSERSGGASSAGIMEAAVLQRFCVPPSCLRQHGFAADARSEVGSLREGRLESDGRRGFLYRGPYLPVAGGRYRLVVRGSGGSAGEGWVDAVSRKGTVEYTRFALGGAGEGGVLAEGTVSVPFNVRDFEIRVFVGHEDRIRLEGFELSRLR